MTVSAERVSFDGDSMRVSLPDGRALGAPLVRFARLCGAPA